jgi:phospholipid transport system substrate-binding protein
MISRNASLRPTLQILTILVAAILAPGVIPARAQSPSNSGAAVVRGLYAALLSTMQDGPRLGPSGRYARLAPAVHAAFDLPFMTRLAVGPGWATLSPIQQQQVETAFERYITAVYAERFDAYSGEQLLVGGEVPNAAGLIVQTRIVKSNGEPVGINYLMRREGAGWEIADVYLDGTISELAIRRSEFAEILRGRGIGGLIAALNRKANMLSANAARAG